MPNGTIFLKLPAKYFMAAALNTSNHGNSQSFVIEWGLKYPCLSKSTLAAVRAFTLLQVLI